jgi:hypothetical protein
MQLAAHARDAYAAAGSKTELAQVGSWLAAHAANR